uniref:Aa_trans domain-containing protein n=1 Tax=Globodera pallida TaxID=36090 RepID=A0A183C7Q3_GLOPA
MLLIFVPMVLVNFVRSLRAISVLSSIGNIICIVALTFIFQYLVRAEHQNLSEFSTITNFDGIMAACGAILYSFEGQAMVLPLENRLQKPSQMVGLFGILSVGIAVVSAIYSTSGFLGYITYGAQVKGSITQNLPQNEIQFVVVRLLFTLVMYFGFVIQMYVIVEMLWPEFVKLLQKFCPKLGDDENEGVKTKKLCVELLFRTVLVAIAMLIGLAVPDLENIIPLVGATTGMLLALIFPALLDLLVFLPVHLRRHNILRAFWLLIDDWSLVGLGFFGLVAGLRANLRNILTPENIVA